jgi:hypothetical protein
VIPKEVAEDIIFDVTAGWVYWPFTNRGFLTAGNLRDVADELDELNGKLFQDAPVSQQGAL